MFFFVPTMGVMWIYILAAVIPAIALLSYIYKMDTYEKEPASLLLRLVGDGVLAALVAIVLESITETLLNLSPITNNYQAYIIVLAFLVVAVAEEGAKFFFLYRRTWNDPNFNFLFDGIVYSAFVSLGFAAFENIKYVFSYGLGVVVTRAVFAIPAHLGFSVVMGFFYGRARNAANRGEHNKAKLQLAAGYLIAVFLHGMYDACAMMGTAAANIVFYVVVAVIYIIVFRLVKKESRENQPI